MVRLTARRMICFTILAHLLPVLFVWQSVALRNYYILQDFAAGLQKTDDSPAEKGQKREHWHGIRILPQN